VVIGMAKRSLTFLLFAPVVVYLVAMVAVAAFVTRPPALGWAGLAVASVVALLGATIALQLFTRNRANVVRPHPRSGSVHRLLVVADVDVEPAELRLATELRLVGRKSQVKLVAPVLPSAAHFIANDEERERAEAHLRLQRALRALAAGGIEAQGAVGGDDPLQAVGDALADFPADEILLVGTVASRRSWLDEGFERRARDLYDLPVSTVFGPAPAPTAALAAH
jgi:hypothetical protein